MSKRDEMEAVRRKEGEHGRLTVWPQPGLCQFLPALAAGVYPFLLQAFHGLVGPPANSITTAHAIGAAALLVAVFSVPVVGMIWAAMPAQAVSMRRLAYATVAAPSLYVFLGVVQSMARSPLPDEVAWCGLWLALAVIAGMNRSPALGSRLPPDLSRWRVPHGIAGAILLAYVLFHITNHLFGLVGPEAHAAVMSVGRRVYRAPSVEPLLVLAFLFQIGSGFYLAWQRSVDTPDFHRLIQIASGLYLSVFILGHMNSVFLYARAYRGIPTDWAFATGAPTGLIHDAWNIRLLPHYALGVFFVLTHLASGLRAVLIAHGVPQTVANRLWSTGTTISAIVAISIIAGMSGVRIGM